MIKNSSYYSFFFSSRRRHTRSTRDWSSDVCFPIYRAQAIRAGFADLERLLGDGGGMDRLVPAGGPLPDAVAQVGACLAALRRCRGGAVLTVSAAQVVAVLSGGWLLGSRPFRVTGLWINTFPHL